MRHWNGFMKGLCKSVKQLQVSNGTLRRVASSSNLVTTFDFLNGVLPILFTPGPNGERKHGLEPTPVQHMAREIECVCLAACVACTAADGSCGP